MLKQLAVLSFSVGLSLTGSAMAQERNLPALNAFGRFWGVGWSNGYHSGAYDGRFQHVKNSHPANMYGSNALLYAYQPGYEPQRPFTQASQGYAQPVYSNTGDSQAFGSILQNTPNQIQQYAPHTFTPVPAIPPKPVEPPPTWLRPFLKDDVKGGAELPQPKTLDELEKAEAAEASPSDLLKHKADPVAPKKEGPAESSDDDLLTLSSPKSAFERYNEARSKAGSNR